MSQINFNNLSETLALKIKVATMRFYYGGKDSIFVAKINRKTAILDHMQNAMRVINPDFEIREK